jgi:hypothetical protein
MVRADPEVRGLLVVLWDLDHPEDHLDPETQYHPMSQEYRGVREVRDHPGVQWDLVGHLGPREAPGYRASRGFRVCH